jgi:hypothetical protein
LNVGAHSARGSGASGAVPIVCGMSDELDLAEAASYILAERPELEEDQVWSVLRELEDPPAAATDLALHLIAREHPEIPARVTQRILDEWRAYASLAGEPDWDDEG